MDEIAEIMFQVCAHEKDVRGDVAALRARFADVKYGYAASDLA